MLSGLTALVHEASDGVGMVYEPLEDHLGWPTFSSPMFHSPFVQHNTKCQVPLLLPSSTGFMKNEECWVDPHPLWQTAGGSRHRLSELSQRTDRWMAASLGLHVVSQHTDPQSRMHPSSHLTYSAAGLSVVTFAVRSDSLWANKQLPRRRSEGITMGDSASSPMPSHDLRSSLWHTKWQCGDTWVSNPLFSFSLEKEGCERQVKVNIPSKKERADGLKGCLDFFSQFDGDMMFISCMPNQLYLPQLPCCDGWCWSSWRALSTQRDWRLSLASSVGLPQGFLLWFRDRGREGTPGRERRSDAAKKERG